MPLLRIRFTPEDLARIQLAPHADLHWETAFSLTLLGGRDPDRALSPWLLWARRHLGSWGATLLAAAPPVAQFPGFVAHLKQDGQGDLAAALDRYHSRVITPFWPAICASVARDRARRTRILLTHGLEGLLHDLAPQFRWQAPVLETEHPRERELHLNGRGLILVPTYFGTGRSAVVADRDGPVVLVDSIAPQSRDRLTMDGRHSQHLDALLGSTRAAVLRTLGEGRTTTELARRVGVSASTASQHATVLREAGLITTQRRGSSVLHLITTLGEAVLEPAEAGLDRLGRVG